MIEKQTVYVIQNQHRQYLDKHGNWYSGKDLRQLYRSRHHDEALNTLIELNARDIELRGQVLNVKTDDKNLPRIEISPAALAMDEAVNATAQQSHNSQA